MKSDDEVLAHKRRVDEEDEVDQRRTKVDTREQCVGILTKTPTRVKFTNMRELLRVKNLE